MRRVRTDGWLFYVGPSAGGVWREYQWAHRSAAPALGAVFGGYVYENDHPRWRIELNPHASKLNGGWRFDMWMVMGLVL